jgi:hypothetical protein
MKFISDFLTEPVPADSFWMSRYFKGDVGYDFVRYFISFRTAVHFSEHFGRPCSDRWTQKMKRKFIRLEKEHSRAKMELDFEKLAEIEMGRFKLK